MARGQSVVGLENGNGQAIGSIGVASRDELDMADAYATFANDGVRNAPYYIETKGAERDPYNWVPESSRRARGSPR